MDQKSLNLQARIIESKVRLGPGNLERNSILLGLKNASDEAVTLDLGQPGEISLMIGFGKQGKNLVATVQEGLDIKIEKPDTWDRAESRILEDRIAFVFKLHDTVFEKKEVKRVTLTHFECNTDPGKGELVVSARLYGYALYHSDPLEIEKKIQEFQVLYFEADPPYVITEKDRKDFTLTWNTVRAGRVRLFKDNSPSPLLNLEAGKHFENGKPFEYREEEPSRTTLYRIEATDREKPAFMKPKERIVQVLESGWHQIDVAHYGSPSLLCKKGKELYGIFTKGGKARLCRSEYPVSVWSVENEEIPSETETSPGLFFDNQLLLLGGSSADPRHCSDRVCYYSKEEGEAGRWKPQKEKVGWAPRMGHACVVFNERIWVMGGFGERGALDDVWSFNTKEGWVNHPLKGPRWSPRCMFATTVFQGKIWIYGGVTKPFGDPLEDMWTSEDGEEWEPYEAIPRDIGEPIGCALEVVGQKLNLLGSFRTGTTVKARHFVLEEGQRTWSENELQEPWPRQELNTFSLSAVEYKGLVFARSLNYQAQGQPTQLALYIPPFL